MLQFLNTLFSGEVMDTTNEIKWGKPLFDTNLSSLFYGQWRASKNKPWLNVVFKCFPSQIPRTYHEHKIRQCFEKETQFLQTLSEIEPNGTFYMKLHCVLETEDKLMLVLEKGGEDVFEHFAKLRDHDSTRSAKVITCVRSMIQCLSMLHVHSLAHNDVKPENYVFRTASTNDKCEVSLIDFGFSSHDKTPCGTSCEGTEMFIHPHMYSAVSPSRMQNDLFAIGVSLFILFPGSFPLEITASDFDRMAVRTSFFDGSWQQSKSISNTVKQLPKFAEWCDLVCKLCNGYWAFANDDILTHPFFIQMEPALLSPHKKRKQVY